MRIHLKIPESRYVETRRLVEWISEGVDGNGQPIERRIPQKKVREFNKVLGFVAGGMYYLNLKQLTFLCIDKENDVYRDSYGHKVIAVKERFPCFDSYDHLHEKRYYRWYYFVDKKRLVCVYYKDEGKTIEVSEDVDALPERAWEKMQKAGWLEESW